MGSMIIVIGITLCLTAAVAWWRKLLQRGRSVPIPSVFFTGPPPVSPPPPLDFIGNSIVVLVLAPQNNHPRKQDQADQDNHTRVAQHDEFFNAVLVKGFQDVHPQSKATDHQHEDIHIVTGTMAKCGTPRSQQS